MLSNLPNGTFLIRVSNQGSRRGEHALSIRYHSSPHLSLHTVPRFWLNTYGRRAFSVAGPMAWNSLLDFIRDPTSSTDCFRRLLTRTCSRVTNASSALGVLNDYVLYKSTHSLTQSLTLFTCLLMLLVFSSLQCFDTVGWASGRASGLQKLSDEVLCIVLFMWLNCYKLSIVLFCCWK